MADREYFLQQAETCLRLARATTDAVVAHQLRTLAAEFQAKARDVEDSARKEPDKET